jgi:hypothetical protein
MALHPQEISFVPEETCRVADVCCSWYCRACALAISSESSSGRRASGL